MVLEKLAAEPEKWLLRSELAASIENSIPPEQLGRLLQRHRESERRYRPADVGSRPITEVVRAASFLLLSELIRQLIRNGGQVELMLAETGAPGRNNYKVRITEVGLRRLAALRHRASTHRSCGIQRSDCEKQMTASRRRPKGSTPFRELWSLASIAILERLAENSGEWLHRSVLVAVIEKKMPHDYLFNYYLDQRRQRGTQTPFSKTASEVLPAAAADLLAKVLNDMDRGSKTVIRRRASDGRNYEVQITDRGLQKLSNKPANSALDRRNEQT